MVQKPGSTVVIDFKQWPCCRHNKIGKEEAHPCYFCGNSINVSTVECEICNLMKCGTCGKCLCDATNIERLALIMIHFNYCMVETSLAQFEDFGEELSFAPHVFLQNCKKALTYCKKQMALYHENNNVNKSPRP